MAEKNGKQGSGKMVRYCIRGHEIVYREGMLVRSRCPVCNSPVDRSRPPITWEEAERIRTEQEAAGSGGEPSGPANEAAEPVGMDHTGAGPCVLPSGAEDGDSPRSTADPTALKTDPPGLKTDPSMLGTDLPEVKTELPGGKTDSSILRTGLPESRTDPPGALKTELPGGKTDPLPENGVPEMAARPGNLPGSAVPFRMPGGNDSGRMPGMPGGAAGIPQGAVKPGGFLPGGGLPGRRDGEHPSSPFGRRETPQQRNLPGFQNSAQPGARDHQSLSAGAGFLLEYFGDRIPIPDEGAWIGREGLGKQWFDGNLMISRKHVFVKPNPKSGRLQVNEDKSLNGVFYQGPDGGRVRMEGARMLSSGEVLWIYNIPLRIVIR